MAQYEKVFTKPYEDGYVDLPNQTTPITAETLNDKDTAIEHIEDFLNGQEFPTALADLTDDETHRLVTDTEIAEWNNKIDSTAVQEQTTTTGEFETKTGGKLESCLVAFSPIQSGSGDPSPSNVRPITGHSSVEVKVLDENDVVKQDVTVPLGNTYYSGTLDVVSGVLTVDKTVLNITKDTNITYASSQFYVTNSCELVKKYSYTTDDIICDKLPTVEHRSNITNNALGITGYRDGEGTYPNQNWIYFGTGDSSITTVAQMKTWLESNPLTVCYKLSTPQTIQLTPQQINTLIGENHLDIPLTGQTLTSAVYRELFAWDDVNDVVELRLPISAIGTDESNNDNASQAYSQGDYFYKNGIAKAKTSIASGATFTLGTNYEIKTLAEILKALES